MVRVIFDEARGQRVPLRIWARAIQDETVRQLQRLASQPYVVEHVAAMADAHISERVAVGSVFATEHTVVPGALGGDLGCGMSAVRIGSVASSLDPRLLGRALEALTEAIPVGDAVHRGRGAPVPCSMRRVVYSERMADRLVEEAPAVYRDIGEVLEDQEDLVRRQVRLEPIAVLKG